MAKKRGRPKRHDHEFFGIFIEVNCPVAEKHVIVKLSEHDFCSTNQECGLCGSHGDVTVDYTCPACGETHEHELKSW